MKLTEFYLELQGRPGSNVALDMETRTPSIPPGYISGIMLQASYSTEVFINNYIAADVAVILVDATAGEVTITLPAASSHAGRYYHIKKVDSSNHNVVIRPAEGEYIDGEELLTIRLQYQFAQILCSGVAVGNSYWHIIGGISVKLDELLDNLLNEQISLLTKVLEELRQSKIHLSSMSDSDAEG